jgi:hypothetical protein
VLQLVLGERSQVRMRRPQMAGASPRGKLRGSAIAHRVAMAGERTCSCRAHYV